MRIAALLGANALLFCIGLGALPLLGVASSWHRLVQRGALAYLCGIAIGGIVAAQLALVRLSFGWTALAILAGLFLAAGGLRLRGTERMRLPRPDAVSALGTAAALGLLVEYGREAVVTPLVDYDSWAIWTFKGRALYSLGWANPAVFAAHSYRTHHLDYPLFLPSLEALDFRVMRSVDTRLVHLQLVLLLAAALAALWTVLRDRVPPIIAWGTILAIAAAPAVSGQLLTAYADIPLALVFGVGAAAAGRWLVSDESWSLAIATLFFGAALLTKNEGALFAAAAFAGLLVAARPRWRPVVLAAVCDVALLVPWRVYTSIYGLHSTDYRLSDTFHPGRWSGRVHAGWRAAKTLAHTMLEPHSWGLLLPIAGVLVCGGLAFKVRRLPIYAIVLVLVSLAGLSWIYVISPRPSTIYLSLTEDRIIDSIVLAAAATAPLLAAEALRALQNRRM